MIINFGEIPNDVIYAPDIVISKANIDIVFLKAKAICIPSRKCEDYKYKETQI